MKKMISIVAALMMLMTMLPTSAMAHGARHSSYKLCTVKSCKKTTNHRHNGKLCRPHTKNDGHSYHKQQGHKGRHH